MDPGERFVEQQAEGVDVDGAWLRLLAPEDLGGQVAERAQVAAASGERLRLAHEARAGVGLARGLHDLERGFDAAAQGGVDAVHRAHPPFAQWGVDDPVPDALAGLQHAATIMARLDARAAPAGPAPA